LIILVILIGKAIVLIFFLFYLLITILLKFTYSFILRNPTILLYLQFIRKIYSIELIREILHVTNFNTQ